MLEHCPACLADKTVFCPRDIDAICVHCGKGFCGAHIGEHLRTHCVSLPLDHCSTCSTKEELDEEMGKEAQVQGS